MKTLRIFSNSIVILLFIIIFSSTTSFHISASSSSFRTTDTEIMSDINPEIFFESVDIRSFRGWIEYLTITIGKRTLNSNGNKRAMNWIEKQFQSFNSGSVETDIFGAYESVIGILPGKSGSTSNKIVVIGAHFDTVPTTRGANDNAGGVALVLEAARVLANYSDYFNYDIYFVAFNGEEQALYGSIEVVDHLKEMQKDVMICLNADMILYNDLNRSENQKQGIFFKEDDVLWSKAKYQEWGNLSERISDILGNGYCYTAPTDILHSDHGLFWKANYPALLAFAGRDSYYHQSEDTLNNPELNLTYAVETVATFTTLAAITAKFGPEVLELNDTDQDGLDNQLELILGTSRVLKDSDSDNISDAEEYQNDWNPLDPNNPSPIFTSPITTTTDSMMTTDESGSKTTDFISFLNIVMAIVFIEFLFFKKKKGKGRKNY